MAKSVSLKYGNNLAREAHEQTKQNQELELGFIKYFSEKWLKNKSWKIIPFLKGKFYICIRYTANAVEKLST